MFSDAVPNGSQRGAPSEYRPRTAAVQFNQTGLSFNPAMGGTQMSFFSAAGGVTQNVNDMAPEQLRERLVVAETILKKLYARNRELESGAPKPNTS